MSNTQPYYLQADEGRDGNMVEISFKITEDDFDRLCEIKEDQGKYSMTVNDFSRELLEKEIHKLCHQRKEEGH